MIIFARLNLLSYHTTSAEGAVLWRNKWVFHLPTGSVFGWVCLLCLLNQFILLINLHRAFECTNTLVDQVLLVIMNFEPTAIVATGVRHFKIKA